MSKNTAMQVFYWPNMVKDIEEFIEKCKTCEKYSAKNSREQINSYIQFLKHDCPNILIIYVLK